MLHKSHVVTRLTYVWITAGFAELLAFSNVL